MCTINLTVQTYNAHLFGDIVGYISGQDFGDDIRQAEIKDSFGVTQPTYSLLALQEVWAYDYADNFVTSYKESGVFPYHSWSDSKIYVPGTKIGFNTSGLLMFGSSGFSDFSHKSYYNYIRPDHCGVKWAGQDLLTGKGYTFLRAKFPCPNDPKKEHAVGFMNTHMPTNYNDYKDNVTCCFKKVGGKLKEFKGKNHHPDMAVFLAGDFNASPDASKFADLIQPYIIDEAGMTMVDGGSEVTCLCDNPGASNGTVTSCNNTWVHFNPSKGVKCSRPDHIFYSSSGDGKSMLVTPTGSELIMTDEIANIGGENYCASDHYGIRSTFSIEIDDG